MNSHINSTELDDCTKYANSNHESEFYSPPPVLGRIGFQ